MVDFYSAVPKIPIFAINKTQNLLQEHCPNCTKHAKDVLKTKPKTGIFLIKTSCVFLKTPYNMVHFYSVVPKIPIFSNKILKTCSRDII